MSFLNRKKKKEDSVRPLSEEEIQKKLYGGLRSENVSETQSYTPQEKPSNGASSHAVIENQEDFTQDLFEEAETQEPGASENSVSYEEAVMGQTDDKDDDDDDNLMDEVQEQEFASAEESTLKPSLEKQRIHTWVDEENSKFDSSDTFNKPKDDSHIIGKGKTFETKEKGATRFFGLVGRFLMQVVQLVVGGIVGFFLLLDPRKPKARKFYFVVGVVVIIFGLIYGIHLLNVKREEAMMKSNNVKKVAERQKQQDVRRSPLSSKTNARLAQEPQILSLATATTSNPAAPSARSSSTEQPVAGRQEQVPEKPAVTPEFLKKPYVIQVATYATEKDAQKIAKELRGSGLSAFTKPLSRSSGKVYYCVFLGRYENYKEADKSLTSFKGVEAAKPFQDAFIRKLNK